MAERWWKTRPPDPKQPRFGTPETLAVKPWEMDWSGKASEANKKPWELDWSNGQPQIGYTYRNGRAETDQEHAARIRAEYDAQPWYEQAVTAADDIITHHVANPFGLGDHVRAAASTLYNGGPYAQNLAQERAETRDAGIRAGTAGIAANMVAPLKAATSGLTLAGRFGTAAMTKAQGLAARTGLMAAEGAFYGGADAAGRGNDIARGAALGAAGGAVGNVAGEALSAGVNAVARNFAPQGTRATADALRETAEAAYRRADAAGVTFAPTDTQKVGDSIKQMLVKRGFHPVNEPGVMPVLDALDALSKKPTGVTLGELETVRRVANNGFRPGMASNNAALSEIAERLDDFVLSAKPLTGDGPAAAAALREGRAAWQTAKKLQTVERLAENAAINTAASGRQSLDTATRQQLKRVLQNPRTGRGFTEAEKKAVRDVVQGSPLQNVLRDVGEYAPRSAVGIGAHALGSVANPLLPLATMGGTLAARKASERMQVQSMQRLLDLLTRTPAPRRAIGPAARDALARSLAVGGAVSLSGADRRGGR